MADLATIIGYGSLLSETSARSTFGHHVKNFRFGRVHNYRRVFAHPASIFFQRGIANYDTQEFASLSAEPSIGSSFTVSAFEIPTSQLPDFYDREEEFSIESISFHDTKGGAVSTGLMCCRWSDAAYIATRGQDTFDRRYKAYGLDTIWGYNASSGILPCRVYLRHCILAVQKLGEVGCSVATSTSSDDCGVGCIRRLCSEYVSRRPQNDDPDVSGGKPYHHDHGTAAASCRALQRLIQRHQLRFSRRFQQAAAGC
ncbi:hypothetical protein H310_10831 [Aphanomyces invadans]|uniref:Gamma-glutamylcyclotransferase AIG2-like domain-containing protein n=1 Tax=Aphanomyces invadans TaxID=157072 RepID=A0A024TQ66_9STRA|nr:hypothetical protein H310_10831 [Aphanomyces invadans]ETV95766.1 hypothetical protein H310_10831 [Aphanomyces invadans]|eukprot:XP_008875519.1 hypothetical protein H310_10831 [Aphanomyces invadans]